MSDIEAAPKLKNFIADSTGHNESLHLGKPSENKSESLISRLTALQKDQQPPD
jgi:hypothetical protein